MFVFLCIMAFLVVSKSQFFIFAKCHNVSFLGNVIVAMQAQIFQYVIFKLDNVVVVVTHRVKRVHHVFKEPSTFNLLIQLDVSHVSVLVLQVIAVQLLVL